MTYAEILAMKAGGEMDGAVAERVMGWIRGDKARGDMPWYPPDCAHRRHGGTLFVPRYSTDIAAAWQVVDWLIAQDWHLEFFWEGKEIPGEEWRALIESGRVAAEGYGSTAPEAICRAALLCVEARKE